MFVKDITVLDKNDNVVYNHKHGKGQFPHYQDLFPDEQFYTLTVQGADADTILRVDRADNRPGNRTK